MKQIKNKLKSESGVSILFALLLMLVVAMVSVVMVNASLTAVKRTSAKKDNQQVSISLDSAAMLLRDQMKNDLGYSMYYDSESSSYQLDASYNENTFQPEIKKISEAYKNDMLQNCTGDFKVVTTVDNQTNDSVDVNYTAVKTDTGSCRVVFTLSEYDSQLFVIFNLTLKDSDQVNPKVSWQYGGATLESGQ